MKAEKDCIYQLETTVSLLNQYHQLKPSSYQVLFEQILERHLADFQTNVDHTSQHGLVWVMISMSVEILKPINQCMLLNGSTWYSGRRGPYFRRELLFKNQDGQVMFKGSTHSVLFDLQKRTVFRLKEVPFTMPDAYELFMVEASPNFKTEINFEPIAKRVVHHSFIDCLGHVNNCRYGEFAYDSFTDKEIEHLKDLKRMDIYFRSELRDGDIFTMEKYYDKDHIFFQGYNNTKDDVSFNIVIKFAN